MVLIVGFTFCRKFAFSERWYQLSGLSTDVRQGSGIQGSDGIILMKPIEIHKPERGSGAELLLLCQ